MRPTAIRVLTLTVCTTALIALVATTEGEASSRHVRKHQSVSHQRVSPTFRRAWAAGEIRPVAPAYNRGTVCPGMGRSFDCGVWPPPIDQDPDRKVSGSDGG
jgi:hypothetical protein